MQVAQGERAAASRSSRPDSIFEKSRMSLTRVEQALAAAPHDLEGLALLGRQGRVEHRPGHADHRVERGPDLVAHGGQELALGLVGRRRFLGPAGQLLGTRGLPAARGRGPSAASSPWARLNRLARLIAMDSTKVANPNAVTRGVETSPRSTAMSWRANTMNTDRPAAIMRASGWPRQASRASSQEGGGEHRQQAQLPVGQHVGVEPEAGGARPRPGPGPRTQAWWRRREAGMRAPTQGPDELHERAEGGSGGRSTRPPSGARSDR